MKKNKIYFVSDFHLGSPNLEKSHKREKKILEWLYEIEKSAKAIYFLGDIFDFWFEYKYVVPKGFVRLLGKLAFMADDGIEIHFLRGNHDLWMQDYLKKEIGVKIHDGNIIINESGKKILIGHGDGIGKGDLFYKFLKKIFTSKVCQWIFTWIHPNLSFYLAHSWSKKSRKNQKKEIFKNKNKEILFGYCKQHQKKNPVNYYVFGHRHIPLSLDVDHETKYINTGDWLTHNTYATFENNEVILKKYESK